MTKAEHLENAIKQLKMAAGEQLNDKDYEGALFSVSKCAEHLFRYNQSYADNELEHVLMEIGRHAVSTPDRMFSNERRTVLYYDGLGHDLRGNAIGETKTIASLGYRLVYVTCHSAEWKQPHLRNQLRNYDVIFEYIDMTSGYVNHMNELNDIIRKYCPDDAFFYSNPWDVAGIAVFNMYKGIMNRFYLDINDHAFWLGLNTFDFILNNRTIGQSIEHYCRGIPREKQLRTAGFLFVDEEVEMTELPFNAEEKKFVFSGGALYKTLGDENNTYYRMVEHIISEHDDVNFVYAGYGDNSEFRKLIDKYPDRIFLGGERDDYYQVMKESLFYLNTYPVFGATMMRAAAFAGKMPVTLVHENDADDNLLHQKELGVEFDSYEAIIKEIDRLITDDEYRTLKEGGLRRGYVTRKEFGNLYADMIERHRSEYETVIEQVNTEKFRKEYIERLNRSKSIAILGAGVYQLPLIKKAKEMGLITHVFSWDRNEPGSRAADFFYPISTTDREKILEKCIEMGIDGICSVASDIAVPAVNYVAHNMGLCGNSPDTSGKTTNKRLMRKALEEKNDPIPAYVTADADSLGNHLPADYPVIVKPTDRSGSRGITRADDEINLAKAVKKAVYESFENKAIIEEFIEGDEYSVEHVSFNGKHELLAITRKFTTGAPGFIECSHLLPAEPDAETADRIKSVTEHALDTLGIRYGASHCEIIVENDGGIRIIEAGARMGGDFIGSDLVYYGTGIDYLKCVIDIALGEEPDLNAVREPFPVKSVFLFTEKDFQELDRVKKEHPEKLIRIADYCPENMGKTTDSSNRCGCYIMRV